MLKWQNDPGELVYHVGLSLAQGVKRAGEERLDPVYVAG